jgi:hypothetical protein
MSSSLQVMLVDPVTNQAIGVLTSAPGADTGQAALPVRIVSDLAAGSSGAGQDTTNNVVVTETRHPYQVISGPVTAAILGTTGASGDLIERLIFRGRGQCGTLLGQVDLISSATTIMSWMRSEDVRIWEWNVQSTGPFTINISSTDIVTAIRRGT